MCVSAVLAFALSVRRTGVSQDAVLFWEAESSAAPLQPVEVVPDPSASGWAFVRFTNGTLQYEPWIEAPGEYALWGRVKWRDGCNDAVSVIVNGGRSLVLGNDANYGVWHWTRGTSSILHKGYNTIAIENVSDNPVGLDCFALNAGNAGEIGDEITTIGDRSVIGFNDDFYGGLNRNWRIKGGSWEMGEPRHLRYVEQREIGRAIVLSGEDDWRDYSVQAAIRFGEEGSIGLLFGYAGTGDYYRLCVERRDSVSVLRVVECEGGVEHSLYGKEVRCEPERWYLLRAEMLRDSVQAVLDEEVIITARTTRGSAGLVGLVTENMRGGCFDDVEVVSITEFSQSSLVGRGRNPVEVVRHFFADHGELDCWTVERGSWRVEGAALRGGGDEMPTIYHDHIVRGAYTAVMEVHIPDGSEYSLLLRDPYDRSLPLQRFAIAREEGVYHVRSYYNDELVKEKVTWFDEDDLKIELEGSGERYLLSVGDNPCLEIRNRREKGATLLGIGINNENAAVHSLTIAEIPCYYYDAWDTPVGWIVHDGEIETGHVYFFAAGRDGGAVMWNKNKFAGEHVDIVATLGVVGSADRCNTVELLFSPDTTSALEGYGVKVEVPESGDRSSGHRDIVYTLRRGRTAVARFTELLPMGEPPRVFTIGLRKKESAIIALVNGRPVMRYVDREPFCCRKMGFRFSPIESGSRDVSVLAVSNVSLFQ